MEKIKIVFADDHSVVRSGLRALFQSSPEFTIAGEASDGEQAIRLVELHTPDVALLDITMPKLNGIDATRIMRQNFPKTKVLILTIHEEGEYIYQIIQAGANGYVLKSAEKREIFTAVKSVAAGESFFSSRISKLIIDGSIQRMQAEDIPQS